MAKTEAQRLWEYQVQLRRIAAHREWGAETAIRLTYKRTLKKLQAILGQYYAAYGNAEDGTMTQGDLRKAEQYKNFLQDVLDHLDGVAKPVDKQIRQTIEDTYTACYDGMVNAVKQSAAGNTSLQTALSGLSAATPETVRSIVENPMQKLTLSSVLSRRRAQIVGSTKKTLAVGLAAGDSYTRMAQRIAETLDGDYKKAMRIVRTEANRAINRGFQDVTEEAAGLLLGSEYVEVKEWCSMEDESVRDTHKHLNGKLVHALDTFTSKSGAKADCPGGFGIAKEDINCRCFLKYSFMLRSEFLAQGGVIPADVLEKEAALGLTFDGDGGIIKTTTVDAADVAKITDTMPFQMDADEFMQLINDCQNENIRRAYKNYCSQLKSVEFGQSGYYDSQHRKLVYRYQPPKHINRGRSKYSTLAHEYGHFTDYVGQFRTVAYSEVEQLNAAISPYSSITWFEKVPSSSDAFLSALRKDKEALHDVVFDKNVRADWFSTDASAGVQDAICGMFGTERTKMKWRHLDPYYDRVYADLKSRKLDKILKNVYKDMGFDASNQAKVRSIVRNYETASEMWANIMSATTCGGKELEYIKKYLPNSYNAFIEIMGGLE